MLDNSAAMISVPTKPVLGIHRSTCFPTIDDPSNANTAFEVAFVDGDKTLESATAWKLVDWLFDLEIVVDDDFDDFADVLVKSWRQDVGDNMWHGATNEVFPIGVEEWREEAVFIMFDSALIP